MTVSFPSSCREFSWWHWCLWCRFHSTRYSLYSYLIMAKVGRGCFLEYSIHLVHTHPPSIPRNLEYTCSRQSRWLLRLSRKRHLAECVLQEISDACVDTKLRGIKVTCIVSSDRRQPHMSLRSQCEWGYTNFVCKCFWMQSTMELNLKHAQKTLDTGVFIWGEKYLCKNLGVKEGEGVSSKGPYFWELTVMAS